MATTSLRELAQKGSHAVRLLRKKRLGNGLPFMINSKDLDDATCYLEYPDGTIQLVEQLSNGMDFRVISTLAEDEANNLRIKYQLS
ncbi:hypothetical protein [Olivibacter sitiensis]|uniref:hypothetical protein n=1 Tax=Olivibacter sitiensis TaxID=376470 RepID=UPI0003F7CE30|nr:hypothetical protein [Olivibacter sitiensis]